MDVVSETEEDLHPAATNGQVSAAVTNTEEDDPNGGTWDIAMSLRARKKVRRQERTAENAAGATDPAGLEGKVTGDSGTSGGAGGRGTASDQKSADVERRSRPRQRAPPLPRNDIKIILKPKPGLAVRDLKTYEVARAIMEAAGGSAAGFKCDDMIIRLRPGSNIVIVSTALEEHGKRIEKIKHLNLNGKSHPMSTYVTTPEYLLKGVIHGINTDVTDDEIIDNICVRTQGVEVLQARRLGGSKTVLLMFDGDVLPRYVYLFGGETPCVPYQPTRQYCRTCQETGHRTDVCPKAVTSQCAQCGMGDPPQDHVCKTTCAFCGGEHATGAPECQKKLKQIQSRDRPKPQQQQHRSRPNQRGNIKERWLSSERERSVTPGRSKSRSRPESKGRSSSPEARQPPPPQQKQKKLKQANKEIEVSWAKVASQPKPDNTLSAELAQLRKELEITRVRLGDLERENRQLKKQVQTPAFQQSPPKSNNTTTVSNSTAKPAQQTPVTEETVKHLVDTIIPRLTEYIDRKFAEQEEKMEKRTQAIQIECRQLIRKQTTGTTIRERAEKSYNRPGLHTFGQDPSVSHG